MSGVCAAGFSEHPDVAVAVGEVVGAVLERIEPHPGLALLFVAGPSATHLSDIAGAVRSLLAPEVLLATTVPGVFGGTQEVASPAGVSLLAADLDGCVPIRLPDDDPATLADLLRPSVADGSVVVLVGGGSFRFGRLDQAFGAWDVAAEVVGGGPLHHRGGDAQLLLGDQTYKDGAVGVIIPAGQATACPLGLPMWDDEGDEVPVVGPVEVADADGLVLFTDEQSSLLDGPTLDFEIVFDRVGGTLAGMSGAPFIHRPTGEAGPTAGIQRPRATALVLGPPDDEQPW